ncbi:MAG: hypothetical protein ACK40M_11935, partial [Flavobacteriales bacterium]
MKGVKKGRPGRSEIIHVIKEGEMPPEGYPKLTEEELKKIEHWIELGAMNSSNCNVICDTSNHKFNADVKPILQTY